MGKGRKLLAGSWYNREDRWGKGWQAPGITDHTGGGRSSLSGRLQVKKDHTDGERS